MKVTHSYDLFPSHKIHRCGEHSNIFWRRKVDVAGIIRRRSDQQSGVRAAKSTTDMRSARRASGRDSMASRMWRFRGIIAVISPVILLVLAIVLLMPSTPSEHLPFSHDHMSASSSRITERRSPVDSPR